MSLIQKVFSTNFTSFFKRTLILSKFLNLHIFITIFKNLKIWLKIISKICIRWIKKNYISSCFGVPEYKIVVFASLYMFLLFLQVIKNMIIFQIDAKICSTIWHKIYNSKQFFFQIKRKIFFFTCEKKEFHLHE